MTRQSRTIDASVRALSRFDRATQIARESVRMSRAAANIAWSGSYRWQPLGRSSLLTGNQVSETELFPGRETTRDGAGGQSGEMDSRSRTAKGGSGVHRATQIINMGARVFRAI